MLEVPSKPPSVSILPIPTGQYRPRPGPITGLYWPSLLRRRVSIEPKSLFTGHYRPFLYFDGSLSDFPLYDICYSCSFLSLFLLALDVATFESQTERRRITRERQVQTCRQRAHDQNWPRLRLQVLLRLLARWLCSTRRAHCYFLRLTLSDRELKMLNFGL